MNDKSNFQRRHKKIPLFGDAVHYLILLTTAQLFKIPNIDTKRVFH